MISYSMFVYPEKVLTILIIPGMFHLFANNAQCKHVIFGCCHNSAYAVALQPYLSNPIAAARITLLGSYEDDDYFDTLNFNVVKFPLVFRSVPFSPTRARNRQADIPFNHEESLQQQPAPVSQTFKPSSTSAIPTDDEALAKWQAAANESIPLPTRQSRSSQSSWAADKSILLNVNNERVDPKPAEEDYDTSEDMKDLMEIQKFCAFHHLQKSCMAKKKGLTCKFRHEPELNTEQLVFLRNAFRRFPCTQGSNCRRSDCIYGHVCPSQPKCTKSARCPLYRFHHVDPTVVKIWRS